MNRYDTSVRSFFFTFKSQALQLLLLLKHGMRIQGVMGNPVYEEKGKCPLSSSR